MDKKYIVDLNNINLYELEDVISINRNVDVGVHIPQDVIGKGAEFTNIRSRENIELSNLWTRLNRLMNNLYIQSADKEGLNAYKKLIDDESIKGDLESQRNKIYSLWNMLRVWTHRTLIDWLDISIGKYSYDLAIDYKGYEIVFDLKVQRNKFNVIRLEKELRKIIPANLGMSFRICVVDVFTLKEKSDAYTSRLYPVSNYHKCGTIYRHQYVGKRFNNCVGLSNGSRVSKNRNVFVGERKVGGR